MKKLLPSRYFIWAIIFSMGLSLVVCSGLVIAFFPFWTKGVTRSTQALADILELKPQDDGRENFERIIRFRNRLKYNRIGVWLVGTTPENPVPHILAGTGNPPADETPLQSLPQDKEQVALHNPHSFRAFHSVMRLPTDRPRWLWFSSDIGEEKFGLGRALTFGFFLVISITASVASYMLLRIIFNSRAKRAKNVIAEFSSGNLKARIPHDSPESDDLTGSFNQMADDIENMFARIKSHESLRQRLVAELSHDLRTPLTAIRVALESKLVTNGMPGVKNSELLEIAQRELSYIQRLLEYLFSAAISDLPLVPVRMEKVDLSPLIKQEVERMEALPTTLGKQLFWKLDIQSHRTEVVADRAMSTRLFRNILENAMRYASSRVEVSIVDDEDELLVSVFNDGPPIDLQKLQSAMLGKLGSTSVENAARPETSLGLGSNIISAIVHLHDWEMAIEARDQGTEIMLRIFPQN